ncbi:hypothetical protein [Salinispora tropica]|uniref:hypothetical protein n=1 Tax=Salinispora tropica TaxID=168695 RepID=UPI00048B007F|nr:hypothetical protein [Salinispora tropica]
MADQTQPWAERTVEVPPQPEVGAPPQWAGVVPPQPEAGVPPQRDAYQRGVASVGQTGARRTTPFPVVEEETETGWPEARASRRPMSWHLAQLRPGWEWSAGGALFAFVCWGIWSISGGGNLATPLLIFLLSLLVAAGLFALARLVGRVVLEQRLGRVRRGARGAHLVTAVFLVSLGFAWLKQTEWVVSAWSWITNS